MPGCRTVLLSTVMTASVRWRAFPGRMSCRSHVPVTFYTASSPTGTQWRRWPRRCWAQRNARWRSPTTARMVSAVAWGHMKITQHEPAAVGCSQNARWVSPDSSIVFSITRWNTCLCSLHETPKAQQHCCAFTQQLVEPESFLLNVIWNILWQQISEEPWGGTNSCKGFFAAKSSFEMM